MAAFLLISRLSAGRRAGGGQALRTVHHDVQTAQNNFVKFVENTTSIFGFDHVQYKASKGPARIFRRT